MKYVGFYDSLEYKQENRRYSMASKNVMDYVSYVLKKNGQSIEIISPAWTDNKKGFYPKRNVNLNENMKLSICATFGASKKILKTIRILYSWIWLIFHLLLNTKRNEEIIVYHITNLVIPILFVKYIKNLKLILEVGEIYQDVYNNSSFKRKLEYLFFDNADKFIFSTELLNKRINKKKKPYTILHGAYNDEDDLDVKFDDSRIHILYAGKINSNKGAYVTADISKFLSDEYHIHIIGFGGKYDIESLEKHIQSININCFKCKVSYEGLLTGKDYVYFLQRCHIGLCTQDLNAKYNETSFPSKIISYVANGLRVVSARLKAIDKSDLTDLIYYYENDTAEDIAKVIRAIDLNKPYEGRKKIEKLDLKFTSDFGKLLIL